MSKYYVNDDRTSNPGFHHEVHTKKHAEELNITNKSYLGDFSSCHGALDEAKKKYTDADGCRTCCNDCHKG